VLLIEALDRYHTFYGDGFRIEYPSGSRKRVTLKQIADDLSRRLSSLFLPDTRGFRPCHGTDDRYATDPHWRDLILFYEHFHGDTGVGIGASHQTGWTSLVSLCLERIVLERSNREVKKTRKTTTAS
jgi:hypothetical protein